MKIPGEDRHLHSQAEFLDDLASMLGGYTVEKEILGELTTGASSDLRQATKLARRLVTEYGMSEILGPRTYGQREEMIFLGKEIHERRDYSEKVAETIDKEISKLILTAQKTAQDLLTKNRKQLDKIALTLLEKETLESDEFEKIVGKKKTDKTP